MLKLSVPTSLHMVNMTTNFFDKNHSSIELSLQVQMFVSIIKKKLDSKNKYTNYTFFAILNSATYKMTTTMVRKI